MPTRPTFKEIAANAARINAYKKFFDPSDMPNAVSKYASEQQKLALKYYIHYYNTKKSNDSKRDFKYAYDQAKKYGL